MSSKGEKEPQNSDAMTFYEGLSLGIILLETVTGILVNGYMVLVNLLEFVARQSLGPCDSILTCLGLSRFCFQWMVLVMYLLSLLFTSVASSDETMMDFMYCWLFVNNICLWFATWLCTFYCFRIVNNQQRVFAFLKSHFDSWVPVILSATVVISALCMAPGNNSNFFGNWSSDSYNSKNNSQAFHFMGTKLAIYSSLSILGSAPPFAIFCMAAWLVVGSLQTHMRRMKVQLSNSFREPSLKAHRGAIKTMFHFFIFYFLYMVALNLRMSGTIDESSFLGCLCAAMIGAYPSMHSVLLVLGNNKLRQSLNGLLQKGKCCDLHVAQTETFSDPSA